MKSSPILSYLSIKIAAVCALVFLLQYSFSWITGSFALNSAAVWSRPWTIITSAFLHGSAVHLLYNMFALLMFGPMLERILGARTFLLLYFSAMLASALACILFYPASLGASGAIFGILGALAVLRPKMIVWVFSIPMPMAIAAVFWGIGDFIGMFMPSGTANAAHLAGLAVGLGFGFYFFKKYGEFARHRKSDVELSRESLDDWERKWME